MLGTAGVELSFGDTQLGAQPVHGSGLGEPGLHAGTGGFGDVKQPVTDDPLADPVFGELQPQPLQRGPDRQDTLPPSPARLAGGTSASTDDFASGQQSASRGQDPERTAYWSHGEPGRSRRHTGSPLDGLWEATEAR